MSSFTFKCRSSFYLFSFILFPGCNDGIKTRRAILGFLSGRLITPLIKKPSVFSLLSYCMKMQVALLSMQSAEWVTDSKTNLLITHPDTEWWGAKLSILITFWNWNTGFVISRCRHGNPAPIYSGICIAKAEVAYSALVCAWLIDRHLVRAHY